MTKYYGYHKLTQDTLDIINQRIRKALDDYYLNHDAESFFTIVDLLNACRAHGLTKDEIPAFIEMQNVVVLG